MARKLVFAAAQAPIFDSIFNGFHIAGRPGTKVEHRLTARILDALEEASDPIEEGKLPDQGGGVVPGYSEDDAAAPRRRRLKAAGASIVLEDAEYEFLAKSLEAVHTVPVKSRDTVRMWAFLEAAKTGSARALTKAE